MKYYNIILILVFSCLINHAYAQGLKPAFKSGEWLEYKVKYGWFNATTATLNVNEEDYDGKKRLHISGKGRTTGLIDLFFKVRDHYQSYINPDTLMPYKFIRDVNEGGYKKNKAIYFNHQSQIAEVHDYKKDTVSSHSIKPETQDLMSALYYLRNEVDVNNLSQGDEFTLNLFFDEGNYDFKTVFLGWETIETKFGDVNCLKFRPYVKAGRIFEEKESVTIWISNDQNKIPIKIKANLAVGSLVANLNAFKGLANSFKITQE